MKNSAKLFSVFAAVAVMSFASCSRSEEEKAAMKEFEQSAKTEQAEKTQKIDAEKAKKDSLNAVAIQIRAAELQEKKAQEEAAKKDREFHGLKAAYYLQAKADSLESTEVMGNHKYDLGAGFPRALREFEKAFAKDTAYEYVAGFIIDREINEIKIDSKVIIRDKAGNQTSFSAGKMNK